MASQGENVGGGGSLSAGATVTIQPPSGESWTLDQLLLTYSNGDTGHPLGDRMGIRYAAGGNGNGWIWGTSDADNDPRPVAAVGGSVEGDGGKQWSIRPLPMDNSVYVVLKNNDCSGRSYIYNGYRHL